MNRIVIRLAFFAVVAAELSRASPAMADWESIVNLNSGLCMGVTGGIMQPGQPIIQWPCDGSANQLWWVPTSPNVTTLPNGANSSYCLSVSSDVNEGSQLVIQPCGAEPWQASWNITNPDVGGNYNAWVLQQQNDGYVAAADAAAKTPAKILQWQNQINGAFSHPEQQWVFESQSVSVQQSVTFGFSGVDWAIATAGGAVTFDSNGNSSVNGGEITVFNTDAFSDIFVWVTCPQSSNSGLGLNWEWIAHFGGNAGGDAHNKLIDNNAINPVLIIANWPTIVRAWQSSNQLTCDVSESSMDTFPFTTGGSDTNVSNSWGG
jgi:hypothetical protein